MKELSVHGGGAVLARISDRFGLRWHCDGMDLGMDTVSWRAGGEWKSDMAILTSSSSNSSDVVEGDEAAEEVVRIDKAACCLREFITVCRNCL